MPTDQLRFYHTLTELQKDKNWIKDVIIQIVQLGTKLNTKIGLNHHPPPPPGTFQRKGKVLAVPNTACKPL